MRGQACTCALFGFVDGGVLEVESIEVIHDDEQKYKIQWYLVQWPRLYRHITGFLLCFF